MTAISAQEASMTSHETFRTYSEARQVANGMRGWDNVRPSLLYLPGDPNANHNGNAWVVRIGTNLYLRRDGFVR